MAFAASLLLALSTAGASLPAPPPPSDPQRLAIEGVSVGDPESRLVTLMPTARCSDVEGLAGVAERWCRIPDQRVFGVLPESLTATLSGERIDTVIARVPRRVWPLLRANLVERYGAPEERVVPVDPVAVDSFQDTPDLVESLRWTRGGVRLGVAPDADGVPVLSIQRLPGVPDDATE